MFSKVHSNPRLLGLGTKDAVMSQTGSGPLSNSLDQE